MAYDSHGNFGYSLVATAPSPANSGTSLGVTAAQGAYFPVVPFNAVVWPAADSFPKPGVAEIIRVTGKATDTFTIARAQEGTAARTIVVGDQIALPITAKTLTDIETGSLQVANNLSEVTAATARTNLGLGSAAVQAASAFEVAGAAATEQARALAAEALNAERAAILTIGGGIPNSIADGADFNFVVPYNATLKRMKVATKAAVNSSMVVKLRSAAATITTPPTFADVTGFTVTFSSGNVLAVVDPADVNVGEGDMLGLSVTAGSGTNILVAVVLVAR